MNTWKHKDWQTFKGTWLIVADLSDDAIISLISADSVKYGNLQDWSKA